MPYEDRDDVFDRECSQCGHDGMVKTQVPGRDGPVMAYKCPACDAIDPDDKPPSGTYVSKR